MSATVPRRPPAAGDNSLKGLEEEAKQQQIAAQHAWHRLMEAQIEHNQPWVRILSSAARTGVATDDVRRKFNVSPSTFSRWLSGFASPSNSLRTRLAADLAELTKAARGVVRSGD
jgi:transcriptional regulator with XRE-family HTH domain